MTAEECGKPLSAIASGLGVRIYRDGRPYGFWEPEAQSLMPGDCIVEILPTAKTEAELDEPRSGRLSTAQFSPADAALATATVVARSCRHADVQHRSLHAAGRAAVGPDDESGDGAGLIVRPIAAGTDGMLRRRRCDALRATLRPMPPDASAAAPAMEPAAGSRPPCAAGSSPAPDDLRDRLGRRTAAPPAPPSEEGRAGRRIRLPGLHRCCPHADPDENAQAGAALEYIALVRR